jgi:molybdopterin molybdotransferase
MKVGGRAVQARPARLGYPLPMLTYHEALAALLADAHPLDGETVTLDHALGRVLAQAMPAPLPLPSFDNAAMDGYAFRAGIGELAEGRIFAVGGMQAAGDATVGYPGADACEIATGARVPEGFDTVVPVERVHRDDGTVRLTAHEPRGQNIRRAGEDIVAGEVALEQARRLQAPDLMLLAALGVSTVRAVRQPRVAVINTGSELHAAGPLPEGGIHDSNGPYLSAVLSTWGVQSLGRARVPDTGRAFHDALHEAREGEADLIITTGAVSAGRFDFVPSALAALGAQVLFHKVAIRPGKPVLAARIPGGPLVVALPGNPMAVAVGWRFFLVPLLRAWAGLAPEGPRRLPLLQASALRAGLQHFQLGRLQPATDGTLAVSLLPAQAAYRIVPFTQADVWVTGTDALQGVVDTWPVEAAIAT